MTLNYFKIEINNFYHCRIVFGGKHYLQVLSVMGAMPIETLISTGLKAELVQKNVVKSMPENLHSQK